MQVDVVARRVGDVEADSLSNHKRDGFGFQLARIARARTIVAVAQ